MFEVCHSGKRKKAKRNKMASALAASNDFSAFSFSALSVQYVNSMPPSIVWSEICGGAAQEGATHEYHVAASRAFKSWARLFSS